MTLYTEYHNLEHWEVAVINRYYPNIPNFIRLTSGGGSGYAAVLDGGVVSRWDDATKTGKVMVPIISLELLQE